MRVTDLNKRPVMDVATATTVGRIDDVVVDPSTRQLVGFSLRKTPGKASWLAWDRLKALGADAATIDNVEALTEGPDEEVPPALKHGKVIGGIVLTNQGLNLGNLVDVEFEADSGSVTSLVLDSGRILPADGLIGIGTYAMVVSHPPDAPG
jgi:sporulation protein YlmC with PRC-barrel domain